MPAVADCPECSQQVSIPLGAPPEAEVQCPLCGHTCLLEEVLKHAPPELVLLNVPETVGASSAGTDSSQLTVDDTPFDEWGTSEEKDADEQDTDRDLQLEDPPGSQELVPVGGGFDFGGGEIDAEGAIDARTQSSAAAAEVPSMAPLMERKRKNRGGNPMRQMIGVFGGGFMGLAIGYVVLLWIRPEPRVDFLKIGPKLPAFMVPAAFHTGDTSAASEEPPEKVFDSSTASAFDFNETPQPKPKKPETPPSDPLPSTPPESTPPSTEPPKAEPPKIEPPTIESPKITPPSVEPPKAEPPKIEPPKAEPPKADPKPTKMRVRGSVPFTSEQLGVALKDARDSEDGLVEGSLEDDEFKLAKLNAFKQWCRLAEVYTYSKKPTGDPQMKNRQEAVRGLTLNLSDALEAHPDLGRMGSVWMRTANRTSDGVLTVGRILEIKDQDDGLHDLEFLILGQTEPTTVVTGDLKSLAAGDLVVTVGTIVSNPKVNLIGYQGEAEQAIWSKLLIKVIGE